MLRRDPRLCFRAELLDLVQEVHDLSLGHPPGGVVHHDVALAATCIEERHALGEGRSHRVQDRAERGPVRTRSLGAIAARHLPPMTASPALLVTAPPGLAPGSATTACTNHPAPGNAGIATASP